MKLLLSLVLLVALGALALVGTLLVAALLAGGWAAWVLRLAVRHFLLPTPHPLRPLFYQLDALEGIAP